MLTLGPGALAYAASGNFIYNSYSEPDFQVLFFVFDGYAKLHYNNQCYTKMQTNKDE